MSDVWGRGIPDCRKSKCKGPKVGACLLCLGDYKEAGEVARAGGTREKAGAYGVRKDHEVGMDHRGPFVGRTVAFTPSEAGAIESSGLREGQDLT